MAETRDDRYRRRYIDECRRAEAYRNLALAVITLALRGVDLARIDWADYLDEADLTEVARRRRSAHTGHRNG